MVGNSTKSLCPRVKQTSEQIFVFLFLQFAYLADKINKVYMPVCPSESMWVFMFKLAVFPGVNAMLPLVTMWWCALKTVSVYVAKEELHTALESHAEFTRLHGLQIPLFQEGKKNAAYEGSSRGVPGQCLTHDLLTSLGSSSFCVSGRICAVTLLIANFNKFELRLHGRRLTPCNCWGSSGLIGGWHAPVNSEVQHCTEFLVNSAWLVHRAENIRLSAKGRKHPAKRSAACSSSTPLGPPGFWEGLLFTVWNAAFPMWPREMPVCLYPPWWQTP